MTPLVTHLATSTAESIPQAYFNRLGFQMTPPTHTQKKRTLKTDFKATKLF